MRILLITTDQQRADSLGAYGNPVCRTPNLDGLAAHATRFTGARCQNPYCQPSRATILTGTYPSTHGVTSIGIDLPQEWAGRGFPAQLAANGYRTSIFGKAHFASAFPAFPTGQPESVAGSALVDPEWNGPYAGFDHAELVLFGHNARSGFGYGNWNWCFGPPPFGLHYARWLYRDGTERGRERLRLLQPEAAERRWPQLQTWHSALPEEDHSTTWIADRAIEYLRRERGDLFTWVSFCDPHHPYDPPAPWSDLYSPEDVRQVLPRRVPGELESKPPIHALWAKGFEGTTYDWANPGGMKLSPSDLAIMIASYYARISQVDAQVGRILAALDEQGDADTLVIFTSDHGDLLGDHRQLFKGPVHYEGLLRVPLLVRGPGFEAGRVIDSPVGLVDLAPTILSAAGVPVPEWMEGRPLLEGPREHVLTENDHQAGFRIALRTLTTERFKVTRYLGRDTGELYDLREDPGEFVNLWRAPDRWQLRSELLALLDSTANRSVRAEPVVSVIG